MTDVATSSTAVDLSRLPAPTVVEQLSYEAILAAMIARVQTLLPAFDATVESDPAVNILQAAAYRELLLRQDFNDRLRQVMVAYATGANLDHLAALLGVTRLVLVEADPENGIEEQLESDNALRERLVLAPEGFSVAGPEAAYIFHARSADGDVLDASATSPDPGEVIVTVLSRVGDGTASAPLLEAVEAVVNGQAIRPLTDLVTVQSAEIVDFEVEAVLTLFSGPDPDLVRETALANLEAWWAGARRLGRDIVRSAIFAALHVPGVQKVTLTQPAADIVLTRLQAPWRTGVDVTVGGSGE